MSLSLNEVTYDEHKKKCDRPWLQFNKCAECECEELNLFIKTESVMVTTIAQDKQELKREYEITAPIYICTKCGSFNVDKQMIIDQAELKDWYSAEEKGR